MDPRSLQDNRLKPAVGNEPNDGDQQLGKIRVALSQAQPNWMFTPLLLAARSVTTGAVRCDGFSVEALLDVFASEMVVRTSAGTTC